MSSSTGLWTTWVINERWMARFAVMDLKSYEYRDPGQVLLDVLRRHALADGDVLLALVREPSAAQEVVAIRRLDADLWRTNGDRERADFLAGEARQLPVPEWRGAPPEHSIMTVVARRGWCLIGREEAQWLIAWRYSNHLLNAFSGELILLTEHGWVDFMSGLGGPEPRLENSPTAVVD